MTIQRLNQPTIKETVKNLTSSMIFIFGLVEAYDICQILRKDEVSPDIYSKNLTWLQTVNKIAIICAKISLILSASVSRPGIIIITSLMSGIFQTAQLEQIFGCHTTFTINPWHPRHIVSLLATGLALPAAIQSIYESIAWVCGKKTDQFDDKMTIFQSNEILSDSKLRLTALFNTIMSRPTLHGGNQFARLLFKNS